MDLKTDLRNTFVSMLFALVITQCATTGYEGIISPILNGSFQVGMFALLSHLTLTVVLVTTSWIGWMGTFSHEERPSFNGVFCRAHFLLILDLIILGLYLSLILSIDTIDDISAKPEILIITAIFFFYSLWDISFSKESIGIKGRLKWAKITAPFFLLLLFVISHVNIDDFNQWYYVAVIDILLLVVVMIFRAFAEKEGDSDPKD